MKKRIMLIGSMMLALTIFAAGVTYAFLASKSRPVVNTFVAGKIQLSLTESTGSRYILVPGTDVPKDPRVTVGKGSEECWLFVRVVGDSALDSVVTYAVDDGWTLVDGEEDVYWRKVSAVTEEKSYAILKNDRFSVESTATEEMLLSLGNGQKLTFRAYAVQTEGMSAPEMAWQKAQSMEEEA
ncbi:MAG: hypothetical protein IJC55_03165 [Clostridia bacterium]|nr:hypothetical protein [Clostridia bacterium]